MLWKAKLLTTGLRGKEKVTTYTHTRGEQIDLLGSFFLTFIRQILPFHLVIRQF